MERERKGASGRTQEIQRLVGRSLRGAANLAALGENACKDIYKKQMELIGGELP